MAAFDITISVTLPANTPYAGNYKLDMGSCTGRDDLDVRRETGYTLVGLLQEAQKDAGLALTIVCTVAWLVRRKQFGHLTFDDVLSSVPWGSDFEFDLDGDIEADPKGLASGTTTPKP